MKAAALVMLLAAGCVVRPVDTQVRRVEALADVDAVADELGVEGWVVVDVEALDNGRAWVLVLQREVKP